LMHRFQSTGWWLCAFVLLAAGVLVSAGMLLPVATASPALVGAWSASPHAEMQGGTLLSNQTVRMVVFPHFGGTQFRVRLSNAFGSQAVTLAQVDVAQLSSGSTIVAGTDRLLTFGGQASVTIPVGSEVASDVVAMTIQPDQGLVVSVYLPGAAGLATWHWTAEEYTYVAAGNHASDASGAAYSASQISWWWLDGVDVVTSSTNPPAYAVVALGDSLTDGYLTGWGQNARWPDDLSRRLVAQPTNAASVLNAGLSGNRVLADSPCFGQSALGRLNRDVLSQFGVAYVVLFEGINDIAGGAQRTAQCAGSVTTDATASQLISGYQQIIAAVHASGLKIYGATLTPFGGASVYSSASESQRQSVNQWIRTSGAFDAVLDFDAVVRDPNNPTNLQATYDGGDHLHLSDAGDQALANSINLALFGPPASAASVATSTPTNTATPRPTNTPTPLPTSTPIPTPTTAASGTSSSSSVFSDGFESGTLSAWSSSATSGSGSVSVNTTAPFAGSYDGLFSRSATSEVSDKAAAVERFTPAAGNVAWGRAWVRFESVPSIWYWNIDNVLQLDDGANLNHPKARFGAHNGGKLFYSYLKKDGTWYAGEWGALTLGTYYGLKIEFDTSGTNPVITWFVNTGAGWVQVATYTDTSSGTAVAVNELRVGASTDSGIGNGDPSYAGTAQNRIDQVAVSATDPN
jgi:lysophospholipase L1-like esterase